MKKKWIAILLVLAMAMSLAACAGKSESAADSAAQTSEAGKETEAAMSETEVVNTEVPETVAEETEAPETIAFGDVTMRIGSLKGPTSMGLVKLMQEAEAGETEVKYEFTMATAADEITTAFVKGDLDVILIPANVASVLYKKTNGQVAVLDINTLGVIYMLESGDVIHSVADLSGKTIYLPGKGTTPDYALQYLLAQNGLTTDDVKLEYKSEGTEVISALAEDEEAIGLLPQPAATAACLQNDKLHIALDLTAEWNAVSEDSTLVTGVTIVRKAYLEENEAAVASFLEAHAASAAFTNENIAEAAEMVAEIGIVPKAAVAAKAIPFCNITCITGSEMQEKLSGYLNVLAGQNPESVGGTLPEADFYYNH